MSISSFAPDVLMTRLAIPDHDAIMRECDRLEAKIEQLKKDIAKSQTKIDAMNSVEQIGGS